MSNPQIISRVILTIIFYCILTALSFILKIKFSGLFVFILQILIIFIAVYFILKINTGGWIKVIWSVCILFTFLYLIPMASLWKISAVMYINKSNSDYLNLIEQLKPISGLDLEMISCYNDRINTRPKHLKDEFNKYVTEKQEFCNVLNRLDAVEIIMDDSLGIYLFVMDRFMTDNGYGILYIESMDSTKSKDLRIRGFDITSRVPLKPNWFYVSFT